MASDGEVRRGLGELLRKLYPGSELRRLESLGPDTGQGATGKVDGYGRPLRLVIATPGEGERTLVFHTATSNEFGHDRRADRAAELLLAFDTFGQIPGHVRALDVGAIFPDGGLRSLSGAGELYLLTGWAVGRPYAEDLRRIAGRGDLEPLDEERCDALGSYLVRLHTRSQAGQAKYRRAIRDLVGHGEGIFGMIDSYPASTPAAPPQRLELIELACNQWRWKLRGQEGRLSRIHGDFHPFNLVFAEKDSFTALDAARGCLGDPADDLTALAINYVFFALERPESWKKALGRLWHRFWSGYLERSGDRGVLRSAPIYFAWRALVVCNPVFYPAFPAPARDALLGMAEQALASEAFDPGWADRLFP